MRTVGTLLPDVDRSQIPDGGASGFESAHLSLIRRRPTVAESIAEVLTDAIVYGDVEPGAPITQLELARRFDVSRIAVRDALHLLRRRGLIVDSPSHRTFVQTVSIETAREVADYRVLLEAEAARIACQRRTPGDLEELDQHIARQKELARRDDFGGFRRADVAFHSRIADLCDNTLLAEQLEYVAYRSQQIVSYATRVTPDGKDYDKTRGMRATVRRHGQMVRALRSRDAEHAEQVFRACIAESHARLLDRLRASEHV
ncbi:MAG: GntR family transcriptional regulator [Chloroflexi bacterium]|nr:GntR family transcriptional regulator [Chloroflexota bacterium]